MNIFSPAHNPISSLGPPSPQKAAKVLKLRIEENLQCMLTAVIKKVEDKRLKNQMSWYTECAHVIIHDPTPIHMQECQMPIK
jgi:hypothetical protein